MNPSIKLVNKIMDSSGSNKIMVPSQPDIPRSNNFFVLNLLNTSSRGNTVRNNYIIDVIVLLAFSPNFYKQKHELKYLTFSCEDKRDFNEFNVLKCLDYFFK